MLEHKKIHTAYKHWMATSSLKQCTDCLLCRAPWYQKYQVHANLIQGKMYPFKMGLNMTEFYSTNQHSRYFRMGHNLHVIYCGSQ